MSYLYEMHCHTSEVSVCASETAQELFKYYTKTDYKGIVLTNHINSDAFEIPKLINATWDQKIDHYLVPYKILKEEAGERFNILLGIEIRLYCSPNDYMVYGVTEDFLRSNGDLMAYSPKDFSRLCHKNNMLLIQAHPFRRGLQIANWELLDGYEVFNGNPHHNSCNDMAEIWAKYHGKRIVTSGSDCHKEDGVGIGGIYFENEIKTNEELVEELRKGNYTLKKG